MITCKECGKELKIINHQHLRFRCSGNLSSVTDYKAKYPDAETTYPETKIKLAHSEDSFIQRYGKKLGIEKWANYCKKLSDKNSLAAFEKKGKTEDEWHEYNQNRAITLVNLIKKYGEVIGKEKFESYRQKQVNAGNTLSWFKEKYGEEAGSIKYADVCKQKGISLENMVRVYGDKGFEKYHSFLEKTKGNFISLSGSQFVRDIVEQLPIDYHFHDGVFSKEFCIYDERAYMYDFVITHPIKIIIEFNGDFWHANPKNYKAEDVIPLRGGPVVAKDLWARDNAKRKIAEARGFQVYYVWESEYIENRDATIRKVLKWIMNS